MSGDRYKITDQHQTYFITCTIVHWIDLFTRTDYKEIVVNSLNYCIDEKGLLVNGWVLMSNHLHLLARCGEPHRMSDFLRDFKKFTSKHFASAITTISESRRDWLLDKFQFEAKRSRRAEFYKIWRDDNHAINMAGIDMLEVLHYIHDNPVRAGIVENPEDYLYSSARDYAGKQGLVKLEMI